MTATIALPDNSPVDTETPQQRAQRRVEELRRSAAGVLEVLAQIYLDEDWKYLTDDTGMPYTGFTSFVQHTLGGSASNARRYRQGVETLVAPLQGITAADTRIPVTPNDIVQLGRSGAEAVLEAAPSALAGITDSAAQTKALRGLLDDVIAETKSGLGQVPDRSPIPEIPATVPAAIEAGSDAWGSDPHPDELVGDTGPDQPVTADERTALNDAVQAVLALDPATSAGEITAAHSTRLAGDCLSAAQRLARIAQLLKALR